MPYQILAIIIWSSSFIAAKYAYEMLPPALLVQGRLLIAALLVLPAARRYLGKIPRDKWKPLLWLTFWNYVAVLMLQFVGLNYTSAASAVTIIGLEPLIMVFVGHFFFGDRAAWYHWMCGAAAFAGVGLLISGGAEAGGEVGLWGCFLIFLAGVAFCGAMRPTQRLIADIGAAAYTSVSLVLAAVLCLPFSLLLADGYDIHWSWQGSAAMLYLGAGCSWFAYWLWNRGMGSVSANLSGLLISLEPVSGVLLAVLVLGEHISVLSGLGILTVIAATFAAGVLPKWLENNKQTV